MKKVFLTLAVIATMTVVSCKEKEAEVPATDVEVNETEVIAPEATTDSTTIVTDSTTTTTTTAPVQ